MDAGGAATNTITSVDRLRERGFSTALAYGVTTDTAAPPMARLRELGVDTFYLPRMLREVAPFRDLATLWQLIGIIRRRGFDLVHTHCSKAGALGRLAAMMCGVPVVHTPHGHIFYGYFGHVPTGFFVSVERWLAKRTKVLVSLTDLETHESVERGIGRRRQYVTVPSGVPLRSFRDLAAQDGCALRESLGIGEDAIVAVSMGRLVPIKGFDVLLAAMERAGERCPSLHLIVVGDGEQRAQLESAAASGTMGARVHFLGHRDDVRPALAAADFFALASRNEGMGRAIIEAMAAGVPVLATWTGGIPTLIEDGESGLLVEPGNAEALAEGMARFAGSPELRGALGSAGADAVFPAYDEDTMIDGLAGIYTGILS